eukprot:TRINITY_DN21022_c0_g1_i3.p1 TRINITY_DN21022_c0_g1~~TRINITY_DN21022_c0_g1_i3.p1  ORF type:complete len:117 (-),score=15.48 TRINITY_DN21022_c0_g1_i3:144-494(-)
MVKIVNGEIIPDDAPNAAAAPNPWASSNVSHGSGESQVGGLTGMSLGEFPVKPTTTVGLAVTAYLLMGVRGLVLLALSLGFAAIRTEHDAPAPSQQPTAHSNRRTLADLPAAPSGG